MDENQKDKLIESILENIGKIDYVRPSDIPNIDLYMDQLTTFMDEQLCSTKRYKEDKILTKTMINNYAKNNLLPPPVKKKYSREHLLVLVFVYYLKNFLSIKDIETLLRPMTDRYFGSDSEMDMKSIYEEVLAMEKARIEDLKSDIVSSYEKSASCFQDIEGEDQDYLQLFAFICNLSFDVYVRKQIIERIIDAMPKKDKKKK